MKLKNFVILYLVVTYILISTCTCSFGAEHATSRNSLINYPISTLLLVAQSEMGKGEIGGDNKGSNVKRYLKGKEDLSWCAAFISYCLEKVGIKELGYNFMARDFYNKGKQLGWLRESPKVGDIIVFWRESKNSYKGHVGIVEEVREDGITTIEGNVGEYPAVVKRIVYKGVPKRLLGYVRIGG